MRIPLDDLRKVREEELHRVLCRRKDLFLGKDLLELGSGTGDQLRILSAICRSAVGLEIAGSIYSESGYGDIRVYDGRSMPFKDESFDVIFSSHVLEHLTDERMAYTEMKRVLKPGGIAVHVVPTNHWRFWTWVAHYPDAIRRLVRRTIRAGKSDRPADRKGNSEPKYSLRYRIVNTLLPPRHGETGTRLTEYFHMRASAWQKRLMAYGWTVEISEPLGLTYTGYYLFGSRIGLEARSFLAGLIGSSTRLLIARPSKSQ